MVPSGSTSPPTSKSRPTAATPSPHLDQGRSDGVQVGFVGAVTEHLPELVSPGGIAEIEVTDIVDATNDAADDLKADGADVVVLLVHEGAPNTDCATMDDDPTSDFGSIITGVNDNVDAIVSGHTHLAYNCSFPVAGLGGPCGDGASGGLGRSVRHQPQPAGVHRRPDDR